MSGRVQRRQAARYDQQDQQAYEQQQQQYAQQQAPAPVAEEDDATAQLEKYAKLHAQGVLTDEEFAAAKAKILGI